MTVKEIADTLVSLCKAGKNDEAIATLYSPDIISTEAMGPNPVSTGLAAIQSKSEWFDNSFEVHGAVVNGPFLNGEQFAVEFNYDVTDKKTGVRHPMHEIALYTVRDGKIAEELFLYGG